MQDSGAVEGMFGCGRTEDVVDVIHGSCCEQSMAQLWWAYYIFHPKTLADPFVNV